LPSGAGEAWHAAKEFDNIVVSRFPVDGTWAIDGNLAVRLDSDAALGNDILLVCAHLPCCTNDSGRQDESDAIMEFFRDAMTAGGQVDVPNGTIFMIMGDLNLVGESRQLMTLLTGDILDNGSYGPDFNPDWDGTGLADVISRQTEMRFAYTWRNDNSSFAPGRLDFIIYTDSEADLANQFIVYTPEMSGAQLAQHGLQSGDVPTVSDHLPHVADFCNCATSDVGDSSGGPGGMRVQTSSPVGSPRPQVTVTLQFPTRLQMRIFDLRGRFVRTLRRESDGVLEADTHQFTWDGYDRYGTRVANGVYLVHVATTPAQPSTLKPATQSTKVYLLR
jgi:endonuclease/exonuclease/phosphatase family metal-dependent hydrolase